MRVLLTGHLGYVGTILAPLLVEHGHQVVGLDADLFRACDFGPAAAAIPTVLKDIRDIEAGDVAGYDAVIHLAGLSNDPLGDIDPGLTYAINHAAAVRLAELARAAGIRRFVAASSCSVYGAAGEDWMGEDSRFNPVTPYAHSKVRLEEDIGQLADTRFSPVFLRAATVYGLSPRIRFDLVINNLAAWAHSTGRVLLKSDGAAWRPVVHVEDMARAFVAALEAPREAVHNRAFNVGASRDNFRVAELAETVHRLLPGSRLDRVDGPIHDPRSYRVNCDLIAATLPAAIPRRCLDEGIAELHVALRRHAPTAEEFEGVRYQRVAHLLHLITTGELSSDLRRGEG